MGLNEVRLRLGLGRAGVPGLVATLVVDVNMAGRNAACHDGVARVVRSGAAREGFLAVNKPLALTGLAQRLVEQAGMGVEALPTPNTHPLRYTPPTQTHKYPSHTSKQRPTLAPSCAYPRCG